MPDGTTKVCRGCGSAKPRSAFTPERNAPDGLKARCRECRSADWRRQHSSNPHTTARVRAYKLRLRYGISAEEYDALLASQESRCALCRSDAPGGRWNTFHVDHCHETGRVRGLLCHKCNAALGVLGDSVGALTAVLAYVAGEGGPAMKNDSARARVEAETAP